MEKTEYGDLLQRLGNLDQMAGVRRLTYADGARDGIRAFEVYNAAGLHFNVLESRCLDIYNLWYKGVPLPFISKPGLQESRFAVRQGNSFKRGIGGGLLYTCGLTNVGSACGDEVFHGRIRFAPAEMAGSFRDADKLGVYGEMRDAELAAQHLVLKRRIAADVWGKTIEVSDIVENRGFEPQHFMLMYHLNWGYPLIDTNTRVFVPSKHARPLNPAAEQGQNDWMNISDPVEGFLENVFVHSLYHDQDNRVHIGLYNDKLALGVGYSFDISALEYIVEWKSMSPGDYVLGLFPSNCHAAGKDFETQNGTIKSIGPLEEKALGFRLSILDGEKDLAEFMEAYRGCVL